jgi:CBS domain containing-hemolysin-like protein
MVLSAFFSGAEIAYVAADRLFLELRMNKGSFLLRQLKPLMDNPAQFLSTTLIGNNLVMTIYGYLMAKALQIRTSFLLIRRPLKPSSPLPRNCNSSCQN